MPFTPFTSSGGQLPWLPSDNAMVVATSDPAAATNTAVLTAGTVYVSKLTARLSVTIANLWMGITAPGTGASTGSFMGLYSSAGVLLSGSADIGGSLLAAGPLQVALTAAQTIPAGAFVWAAIVTNLATTQPTMLRGATLVSAANANLPAAVSRWAVAATAQTTLPASFTPSALVNTNAATFWTGAS